MFLPNRVRAFLFTRARNSVQYQKVFVTENVKVGLCSRALETVNLVKVQSLMMSVKIFII